MTSVVKKKPALRLVITAIIISIGLATACGGRMPSPQTAQKVTTKYFKKYGKKHRWSDFGQFRIEKVEIGEIQELQRNLVEVEAFTYLSEGGPVHRVRLQMQKKTFGWRTLAWENLGTR